RPPEVVFQQRQELAGRHPRADPLELRRLGGREQPHGQVARALLPPVPRRRAELPQQQSAALRRLPAVAAGAPPQRAAVGGGRGVGEVAGGVARHVAIDAVVVVLLAPPRRPLRAGLVGVALEALAAVVAAPPRGRHRQVRVVAGDAAELVLVLA